jgi:hypothetical protein
MARDWRDGFADFFGQGSEDVAPGRKYKPGNTGVVETDIWDTIWGRSGSELNSAKKTHIEDQLESKYKNQLNSLKPGSYVRGSDEGTYLEQLRRLTRADTNTAYDLSPQGKKDSHQMTLQTTQMSNQTEQLKNANTIAQGQLTLATNSANNQMELTRLQMDQQNKDRGFDRETASADRNLSLQLANMQSDLADKRLQYDRETRSMDKRDRAIAQLMSGLGSLGGAFSL